MTEQQWREEAAYNGYSEDEMRDMIQVFRDEEEALTGRPVPWDEIPLFYRLY